MNNKKVNNQADVIARELEKYPNFTIVNNGRFSYLDRVSFELGGYLRQKLDINDNPVTASLNYLYNHHKDMFANRKEVYNVIKSTLESIPEIVQKRENGEYYIAKSTHYAPTNKQAKMDNIVIESRENENYVKHANHNINYNQSMREAMERKMSADGRDFTPPTYRQSGGEARLEKGSNPEPSSNCSSADTSDIIPQTNQNIQDSKQSTISKDKGGFEL